MVEEEIAEILSKYNYPLSTAFIAIKTGNEKKIINQVMYSMLNNKHVEKLDMQPPLWKLTESGVKLYLNGENITNNNTNNSNTNNNNNATVVPVNMIDYLT